MGRLSLRLRDDLRVSKSDTHEIGRNAHSGAAPFAVSLEHSIGLGELRRRRSLDPPKPVGLKMRALAGTLLAIALLSHPCVHAADAFDGAATQRFQFNPQSKMCERAGAPAREPSAVAETPEVSPAFLKLFPLCKEAPTCLTRERLHYLSMKNAMPEGIYTNSFLSGNFKRMAERACPDREFERNYGNVGNFLDYVGGHYDTYPQETKQLHDFVSKLKSMTDTYLQSSSEGVKALRKCLELNLEYSTGASAAASTDAAKLKRYESELTTRKDIPKGCKAVWDPNSVIGDLKQKLSRMRQILALFRIYSGGPSQKEWVDVLSGFDALTEREKTRRSMRLREIVKDRQAGYGLPPLWAEQYLEKKLEPLNGGIVDRVLGSIWDEAPREIAPLTDGEKAGLPEVIRSLEEGDSKHPERDYVKDLKLGDRLLVEYYRMISENPILVQFDSPHVDAKALLEAYKRNERLIEKHTLKKRDDLDYLNFAAPVTARLKTLPEAERGDMCVLLDTVMKNRKEFKDLPEDTLMALMMLEGGAAAWVAKGTLKKGASLLFGARYSGTAMGIYTADKAYSTFQDQLELCANLSTRTRAMCDVASLDAARSEFVVGGGMMLVFGGQAAASKIRAIRNKPTIKFRTGD